MPLGDWSKLGILHNYSGGVRVVPPWRADISDVVRPGRNELEVVVYNTLANHYQTIPSFYKGDPASGLFGPVRLSKVSLKPNRNHL